MGIDYLVCSFCGEAFPDVIDYRNCECRSWCSEECALAEGYSFEDGDIDASCGYCRNEIEEKIEISASEYEELKKWSVNFKNAKESVYEHDYRIENDVDAEKMIKLISELKRDNERLIDNCNQQIEEYKMKIEKYQEEISNMVTPIESALFFWMQNQEVKETKTQFSYKLPSATLKYTKSKPDYLKDDTKLLEWVRDNKKDLIKVKESVDWATFKKDLQIVEDKVLTKDGEVVEGVNVVENEGKFEIK